MKLKYLLISAAALALSTPALSQTINANNTGIGASNSSDNVLVAGSNNGGAATAVTGSIENDNRSNATATGIGGIGNQFGGSATNISPNTNTNTNTALGGAVVGSGNSAQGQNQGQQQAASSNQAQSLTNTNSLSQGNSQSVGGQTSSQTNGQSMTYNEAVQRRNVASAHAPVVVNVASCAIGGSVAGQGPGFGFALGGAKIDKACDTRANAQIMFQLGESEAAVQYLSSANPEIAKAVALVRSRK